MCPLTNQCYTLNEVIFKLVTDKLLYNDHLRDLEFRPLLIGGRYSEVVVSSGLTAPRLFSANKFSDDKFSDDHFFDRHISDKRTKHTLFPTAIKCKFFPTLMK